MAGFAQAIHQITLRFDIVFNYEHTHAQLLCSNNPNTFYKKGPHRQRQRGEGATATGAGAGHRRLSPTTSGTLLRLINLEGDKTLPILAVDQHQHRSAAGSFRVRYTSLQLLW